MGFRDEIRERIRHYRLLIFRGSHQEGRSGVRGKLLLLRAVDFAEETSHRQVFLGEELTVL